MVLLLVILSCIAFLVAKSIINIVLSVSHAYKLVDVPDGRIKVHERPISNMGGFAIYSSFVMVSIVALLLAHQNLQSLSSLYIGLTLLLVTGLVDDRVRLKPYQKSIGQLIAALYLVMSGIGIQHDCFFSYMGALFSVLWIVTIVNAFNLIDVMDGLAATVAFCIAFFFLLVALHVGNITLSLLLTIFCSSLAAFFLYNKTPASIYLGDAGALFIGGLLAIMPFMFPHCLVCMRYNYLIFLFIFAIPLLELTGLILKRTYKGVPFYLPSRDHFSLILLDKGWRKQNIIRYVASMSLFLLITSYAFFIGSVQLSYYSVAAVAFLFIWCFFLTSRHA